MRNATRLVLALALASLTAAPASAAAPPPQAGAPSERPRPYAHPRAVDVARFHTDRDSPVSLPLPGEEDAFVFAVFGDRTGGPAEGVEVLREAVAEVNLFEPDLVMTVGDLIEGYNEEPQWLEQMEEFKGIMDGLLCPWFPVAGNHDVYWRGAGEKPADEHEGNYELHFGPLWYAFEHKGAWFVVLYTDEGDPETGVRTFREPASQRMSPEQLDWLTGVLDQAADAHSVFVFLHHPRWIGGGYGDDWERVHEVLASAGNVRAVFAGHIHQMRYDGPRDGIEYFALATVGGHQSGVVPEAGYLHQYHLVTVREDQLAVAALPVGSAFDPRSITAEVSRDARRVAVEMLPAYSTLPAITGELGVDGELELTLRNPSERPVDVTVTPDSRDSRWRFVPDHAHFRIAAGASSPVRLHVARAPGTVDVDFRVPELVLERDYLAPGLRIALPAVREVVPLDTSALPAPVDVPDRALCLDGEQACVEVAHTSLGLDKGPFTVEAWFAADEFRDTEALVDMSQGGGFGLYVGGGIPRFAVHVGGRYATAQTEGPVLQPETWHHVAGVFDGETATLFVDGRAVATVAASGPMSPATGPLLIGDGVRADSGGNWHFPGSIDEVRVTRAARYTADFEPGRPLAAGGGDADTALHLHMDAVRGPFLYDSSPAKAHGRLTGGALVIWE